MSAPVRSHRVVGTFHEVANLMHTARTAGRLVAVHSARELAGGRVEVVADFREARNRRDWCRVALRVVGWLAVLAVVTGLGWLAVLAVLEVVALVTAVVAWVSAHLGSIVLSLGAVVVLVVMCAGSSCSGLHCGGCRR